MSTGTVDLNRVVTEDEVKALVTVETAERLASRAYRLLVDFPDDETKRQQAMDILVALTTETTNRTCTAVKRQDLSDRIAREAVQRTRRVLTEVEA